MATNRDYTKDFQHNVKVSLEAEEIAKELLEQMLPDKSFVSVRNEPEFFHIGDLLDMEGKGYDVKDDGIIHKTGNVFCEVKKHWKNGTTTDGWMLNGEYNYLVVLDRVDKNIYVLDFPALKKMYRNCGRAVMNVNMDDNFTDGFIVPLKKCRERGVMIGEGKYSYEDCMDYNYLDII